MYLRYKILYLKYKILYLCALGQNFIPTQACRPVRAPIRWTSLSITSLMLESSRDLVYYVHYEEHDRRLDEWVPLSRVDLETLSFVLRSLERALGQCRAIVL